MSPRPLPRAALVVLALVGLGACNDLEVCGSRRVPVSQPDGGAYRCVAAEDCPRTSRESVCVTDVSTERACVTCADTVCQVIIPEPCE